MAHDSEKGHPPHAKSKFRQQQLPSFYPKHSPIAVSMTMFVCAIIFVPLGILVISVSDSIFEKRIRYDHINKCTFTNNQGLSTYKVGNHSNVQGCSTIVYFTLDKPVPASDDSPVFIYYHIDGFYQMYHQYYKSRDDMQLKGVRKDKDTIDSNCAPFRWSGDLDGVKKDKVQAVYSPCGIIAWSMFNDTLNIYKVPDDHNQGSKTLPASKTPICLGGQFDYEGNKLNPNIKCSKKGIALDIDVEKRFKEPAKGHDIWTGITTTPPSGADYRSSGYYDGEPGHSLPLTTDEDFMVWARTAPLPHFSKLYRRIEDNLPAGLYALEVQEYYDTTSFGGEKHMLLLSSSWLGGKHMILGGTMLGLGCLAFVVGMACCILHILNQSKLKKS